MINSGAIMSAAMLLYLVRPEMSVSEKYEYVYDFFSRMAGREHVGEGRTSVPAMAKVDDRTVLSSTRFPELHLPLRERHRGQEPRPGLLHEGVRLLP